MIISGLDIGTTGCKIVLYDDAYKLVDTYYTEYSSKHQNGQHEIDFNDVKDGVLSILKKASEKYKIEALGVTSFGETFAMLDENDEILAPSMLYTDPRGKQECEYLKNILGKERIIEITGLDLVPMYSISKIMWLKNNKPELFNRCKHILLGEDFIAYTLTGNCMLEPSLASRTCAFDINTRTWSKEILEAAGIKEELLSKPVDFGTVVGKIKQEIKDYLGISHDITVVMACHDQIAGMIGSGVLSSDISMDGSGTVECIPVVMDKVPKDMEFYSYGYSAVPFIENKFACYAFSYTGGASLKWFRDNFAMLESKIAKEENKSIYKMLDDNVCDGPTGILVQPHFAGAATPYMDNDTKACFIGVTLEHTKFDFYKALMEGNSYEMLINLEKLKKFTGEIKEIRATGGGANSDVWLQIKADILNKKITCFNCQEVGAAGTTAITGKAIGLYPSIKEAIEKMVPKRKEFYPIEKNVLKYQELYKQYRGIYKALKTLGEE